MENKRTSDLYLNRGIEFQFAARNTSYSFADQD